MNITFRSTKPILSITVEDLQFEAMQKLGRELTVQEIDFAKNSLEWGILSSIDVVYDSIFNDIESDREG